MPQKKAQEGDCRILSLKGRERRLNCIVLSDQICCSVIFQQKKKRKRELGEHLCLLACVCACLATSHGVSWFEGALRVNRLVAEWCLALLVFRAVDICGNLVP